MLHNGDQFPGLIISTVGGGRFSLPDDLAGSYSVVLVNRGSSWCPYCNAQLAGFARAGDKLATAFAYWTVVEVGRVFRASTISMALLATPGLGLLISTLTLHESVSISLAAGIVLIAGGIRLATLDAPRNRS